MKARILLASTLALTLLALTQSAWAWSNGGYSADPNNPDYGTHDWIAERALDWLPASEKALILAYRAAYLYGTELPDNSQAADGIGDTTKHHFYFWSNGTAQDDAAAIRAMAMQGRASGNLTAGDYASAAKWTGAMTHYIADLAVFSHVMGATTDWGAEIHHSDYENHVEALTNSPDANAISVVFDGTLTAVSAYDNARALAHDATFDDSGSGHTAVWMDQHYNWSDPIFTGRAYQSINLAVNYVAEAIHTIWSSAATTTSTQQQTTMSTTTTQEQATTSTSQQVTTTTTMSTSFLIANHVVINEFEQNPPGDDRGSEFVELFNPTQQTVDIGGWIIYTTHGDIESYITPASTVLAPGGFWQLTFPSQFIDNEQDSLVLLNALGQQVDVTPSLADENNDGRSWQRFPDGSDNWVFAPSTHAAINIPELPVLAWTLVLVAGILLLRLRASLPTHTTHTKNVKTESYEVSTLHGVSSMWSHETLCLVDSLDSHERRASSVSAS